MFELPDGLLVRTYGLMSVCKFLTKNEDGVSMAPLSLLANDKIMMESWYYLKDAVLDGGLPFNKAFGMNIYDYNGTDPRFNMIFNQAMKDHSIIIMDKILENYNGFEGVTSLVDFAGGTGVSLNAIINNYPAIKGINFDLPHVVKDVPSYNNDFSSGFYGSYQDEEACLLVMQLATTPVLPMFLKAAIELELSEIIAKAGPYYLKDALLDGGLLFKKAFGMNVYDYCGTDLRFNTIFKYAMKNRSTIIMKKIFENYKGFEGLGSLVDVGGDTGTTLSSNRRCHFFEGSEDGTVRIWHSTTYREEKGLNCKLSLLCKEMAENPTKPENTS
ncbi:hypothetical protein POM88_027647 [Heracleum sosnowskyi]|uniref:O-methyltransferase C-terminal domain-containing protein n=1 Tax=Heracleum sosnowskyi TaxID=360622 RepID=A0AAD8I8W5_9APIA|nr:hypothetical protein POM88_027647 [Heracleum sosnowskyi]